MLWTNKQSFNVDGGKTGFDAEETKLPSYWNTSFSKICLGINITGNISFAVIDRQAESLHSLIADGQYRNTSLGRDTWKALIGSQGSLQTYCNKEGFNALTGGDYTQVQTRIGIISDDDDHCSNCDSRIGFGAGGDPDDSNVCGNVADGDFNPDNGGINIKGVGYILVQWKKAKLLTLKSRIHFTENNKSDSKRFVESIYKPVYNPHIHLVRHSEASL